MQRLSRTTSLTSYTGAHRPPRWMAEFPSPSLTTARGFSALNWPWMPGPGPGWPSRMLPCDTHLPGALASPSWMPHEMPTTWQVDGACPSAVTQTAVPATTGYRSHICICMPGPLATDICSAAAAEEHRVRPPTWMAKFNFTFAEAFLAPVFL